MLHQLKVSIIATIVLAVIVSGIYPAIVWGMAQAIFPRQANGSLIGRDGQPVAKPEDAVGSSLIGQNFTSAKYFHPRPSSAGNGYDPTASGGSNLGPTSAKLINGATKKDDKGNEIVDFDGVHDRIVHYCLDNNIPFTCSIPIKQFMDAQGNLDDVKLIKAFNADNPLVVTTSREIPADAVTGSGSGLDPHISPANAELQAPRVADARKIPFEKVQEMIRRYTDQPDLGILGNPGVNVLRLNLALDQAAPAAP
ncbi:MAG TPA: potassium-transporting ATPase subunit C [Tepidisphaeraceae bacterium]|nr:potassium-transporting ATPase subunit C [Tepidisphaeraceae bacterium]